MSDVLARAGAQTLAPPRNVRGLFAKEMYLNADQAAIKEAKHTQHRQELLQQIEEKRLRKDQERQRQELEDVMYMERVRRQQEDIGLSRGPGNERKISTLRTQKYPDQQNQLQQPTNTRQPQTTLPNDQQQQYLYYPPIAVAQPQVHPAVEIPEIEDLKGRLQQIIQRQQPPMETYASSQVDYDVMKEYYNYQQLLFDRDMNQLREQLTKADMGRLTAEKELMYLQERAKEKHIWNLLDNDADARMPNLANEQRSIFRTAKYAMGNLSEAERRQRILKDYYKLDRNALALGPLQGDLTQQPKFEGKMLAAETQHISANGKEHKPQKQGTIVQQPVVQQPSFLDDKTQQQVTSLKDHDRYVRTHIHEHAIGAPVKNPEQYKQMLEQNSLVQVMSVMRMKGDKKVMTPMLPESYDQGELEAQPIRRQNTGGIDVLVTFTHDLPPKKDPSQKDDPQEPNDSNDQNMEPEVDQSNQSSVYDFPVPKERTEDLLEPPKMDDIPKLQFGWEVDILQKTQSEFDPLDQKISGVLDNIKTIVERKKAPEDYYQVQTQLRVHQLTETKPKQPVEDKSKLRENIPHWKPIKFSNPQPAPTPKAPTPTKAPTPVKVETAPRKPEQPEVDPLDRLDQLLINYHK